MNDLLYSILKGLYEGNEISQQIMEHDIVRAPGESKRNEYKKAYDTIKLEEWIEKAYSDEPNNRSARYRISENGKTAFIEETKSKEKERERIAADDKINTLKMDNLWYTTNNAKEVFEDYPRIKKNQEILKWVAISSAIISMISLFVKCNGK